MGPDEEAGLASAKLNPLERLGVSPESADHALAVDLADAIQWFEFGDHKTTRARLQPILTAAESDVPADIRDAAQVLVRAMGFEPGAVAMAAACVTLFVVVLLLVY